MPDWARNATIHSEGQGMREKATAFVLLTTVVSCVYLHGDIDYEKDIDFSQYQSFAVERSRPLDASGSVVGDDPELAGLVDSRALARIKERLLAKGLLEVSMDEADLQIGFYLTAQDEVHVSDRPGHERWLRVDLRDIAYDSYTRGTLVIDFADRARNLLVWHGVVLIEGDIDDVVARQVLSREQRRTLAVLVDRITDEARRLH